MSAFYSKGFNRLAGFIPGMLLFGCTAGRFYGNIEGNVIAIANAAVYTACVIGRGILCSIYNWVVMFAAFHLSVREPAPKFNALNRRYRKYSMADNRFNRIKEW